jgi:protein TonB
MSSETLDWDPRRRRRRRGSARWAGPALGVALVAVIAAFVLLRGPSIGERHNDRKIINVVLPPPPPPPPPPPEVKPPEPKPQTIQPPQPTPQTPPPPEPAPPAPQANDALTAREGTAPGNFNVAAGDGSGHIGGGKPGGGDPFAAYGQLAYADVRRAVQDDPVLAKGRYAVRLLISVSSDGRITAVRLETGTGDKRRDTALQRLVSGLTLSQRPPAGLPPELRIELNSRPSL